MTSITGKPNHRVHVVHPTSRRFTTGRSTAERITAERITAERITDDRITADRITDDRMTPVLSTEEPVTLERTIRDGNAATCDAPFTRGFADLTKIPHAFTLIEVLLVLALVLMLASVVTPNLMQLYQRTAVNRQAMQVQMVLARARTRAIEQMGTQVFQYKPGGTSYSIQTWQYPDSSQNEGYHATDSAPVTNAAINANSKHELLSSCSFLKGSQTPSGEKVARIFFFPDGTATSHQMGIAGAADETHWISIDPLTGASRRQKGSRSE